MAMSDMAAIANELQQGIHSYLAKASSLPEGTLYVKVAELEPVTWPPDSNQFRGELFLSVSFLGADRTKLDQALARVRKGFKRNEILPGWHVELQELKAYSHPDDEVGAPLLTLPAVLTLEPLS